MLIDKKELNNLFELTPELLFGCFPAGWRQMDDVNEPTVTGDQYSHVVVYNDKIDKAVDIELLLFKPNGNWSLIVRYIPAIYLPVVLNGKMGSNLDELLTNLYSKLGTTPTVRMQGLAPIILNLARAMYAHREVTKEKEVVELRPTDIVKYDSDIPRCSDLIPDPQHYSISRILDWIGRRLRLACIHNPYINVSQSDICMVLDSEFIGHGEHKVHVHDQKLIDALTRLGYTVEILDNMNAVDCIRISGWKTLEMKKGGKENV